MSGAHATRPIEAKDGTTDTTPGTRLLEATLAALCACIIARTIVEILVAAVGQ